MNKINQENSQDSTSLTTTDTQGLTSTLARQHRISPTDTTRIMIRQLASIDFKNIEPIPQTDKTPTKMLETIDSLAEIIEQHGLDPGRCLDFYNVRRSTWHDWLNYAKQGKEPYYSKLKKLKSVVLGWLCGLSSKVYNLKGAKGAELADKALERFFKDSERDRQTSQTSQQTNIQIINLGEYGLNAEDVRQDVSEFSRLRTKSQEISSTQTNVRHKKAELD